MLLCNIVGFFVSGKSLSKLRFWWITRCARDSGLGLIQTNPMLLCNIVGFFVSLKIFEQAQIFRKQKIPTASSQDLFVGVAGFEPATSWSQTRRDDRATLHPEKVSANIGLNLTSTKR
jgi:hypothetical protein